MRASVFPLVRLQQRAPAVSITTVGYSTYNGVLSVRMSDTCFFLQSHRARPGWGLDLPAGVLMISNTKAVRSQDRSDQKAVLGFQLGESGSPAELTLLQGTCKEAIWWTYSQAELQSCGKGHLYSTKQGLLPRLKASCPVLRGAQGRKICPSLATKVLPLHRHFQAWPIPTLSEVNYLAPPGN